MWTGSPSSHGEHFAVDRRLPLAKWLDFGCRPEAPFVKWLDNGCWQEAPSVKWLVFGHWQEVSPVNIETLAVDRRSRLSNAQLGPPAPDVAHEDPRRLQTLILVELRQPGWEGFGEGEAFHTPSDPAKGVGGYCNSLAMARSYV